MKDYVGMRMEPKPNGEFELFLDIEFDSTEEACQFLAEFGADDQPDDE